jgi:hypothetical protein
MEHIMQLSKRTVDIFKNFATINQSIVVNEGSKLQTMAVARNILAEAEVEEKFTSEFAIYNLNEFLAAVSLFQDPELEFGDKWVIIREKGAKRGGIKYFYSNKALIVHPTKAIKMPDGIEVEFLITETILTKISRAAGVLGVSDVAVVGDADGISLIVQDRKNDSSNDFEIQVVDKAQTTPFKFYFKQENLKFIPNDYNVQISPKGIASFKKADGSLHYAVALEAN